MSGAELQTAGQVRNSFPFIMRKSFAVNLLLVDALPAIVTYDRQPINETLDLPFDYGPDKSGRLYVVINNVGVNITSTVYGAAGVISGTILFQDTQGQEYFLFALGDTLPNARAYNSNATFGVYAPLFSARPGTIGHLIWRDNASVIGPLNITIARVTFNIGYYGDYAQFDYSTLATCKFHDHDRAMVDLTKEDQ